MLLKIQILRSSVAKSIPHGAGAARARHYVEKVKNFRYTVKISSTFVRTDYVSGR